MNTEQNYVGKGDSTTSTEPTATPNVQAANTQAEISLLADNRPLTTIPPFNPNYINVPVYLAIHGKDEYNLGVSQIDVLLSALTAYKKIVKTHTQSDDKEATLDLIDEIRETILDRIYNRLSESASILHNVKHALPQ